MSCTRFVEVPVAVEELINVGEDPLNRTKLKDVVKTIEEDDPTEDEMNLKRTQVSCCWRKSARHSRKNESTPSWTNAVRWSAA